MSYTPIVGLEIHVELSTKSKMFCACDSHHFRVKPNTHTCPVCLGLPGALPVPNRKAIEWCQLIGAALNCELANFSKFDRKNYFYPDLPKAYQISQYDQPLCYKGKIELENGKTIGITRVHMEEDTAKNIHKDGKTLVDFNRSSVPLVEIVTEPDFRNAEDIDLFLKQLRQIIRYLEVSDADMEKGSMRLELNMSLAKSSKNSVILEPAGSRHRESNTLKLPPYKVEVKNINSFKYLQKAFTYELKRQSELLDQNITPDQETRGYQEDVDRTISQRSKENAQDYRYLPDPDIPPMQFTDKELEAIKSQLPELPLAKKARFEKEYNLKSDIAKLLVDTKELANYFETAAKSVENADLRSLPPTKIANAIVNKKYDWTKLEPKNLIAKIKAENADQISDTKELETIIDQIITDNPKLVEQYKAGKIAVIGFLIGQVMQATKGKANPKASQQILKEKLS